MEEVESRREQRPSCLGIQGARWKMRGSVLYSTLSTFSESNAVDTGRYTAAVESW